MRSHILLNLIVRLNFVVILQAADGQQTSFPNFDESETTMMSLLTRSSGALQLP
jgi:hypothetical protein